MLNMAFQCQLHPHKFLKKKKLYRETPFKNKKFTNKKEKHYKKFKKFKSQNQMNKNLIKKKLDVLSVVKRVI